MSEPGTVKVGDPEERTFLFLSMTKDRMQAERDAARKFGIKEMVDFRFVIEGRAIEMNYDELVTRLTMEINHAKTDEHY